jgi:membrane-bound lytic murein transglycosylase A
MNLFVKGFYTIFLLICFTGCSTTKVAKPKPIPRPTTHFVQSSFENLDGWDIAMHEKSFSAFLRSCHKIQQKKATTNTNVGEDLREWQNTCSRAIKISKTLGDLNHLKGAKLRDSREIIKIFFQNNFIPYKVGMSNHGRNLTFNSRFTGYYEIELHGSKKRHKEFQHPIHKPPANLKRIKGSHHLKRSSINKGSLHKHKLEIAWVNDMPRLYFMHIQGTGVVRLKEGGEISLMSSGSNGFSFKSLPSEYLGSTINVMHKLRKNGQKGHEDMDKNDSYMFFQQRKETHAVGAQNVMLTPEYSAAIDSSIYPYGIPIWVEIKMPYIKGYTKGESYKRLFIGQDRGGAIKGGGRVDLFFGRGKRAENVASSLHTLGNMYVLFPKQLSIPSIFDTR